MCVSLIPSDFQEFCAKLCQSWQFFHSFQNIITSNKFVQSQNVIPKRLKQYGMSFVLPT